MTDAMRHRVLAVTFAMVVSLLEPSGASAAELIMFESRGCPWCARWHAEIGPAYPKTAEGRRAPLRRFDISRASSLGIVFTAPVMVSPTFVLVDGGKEIGRITGYPGPDFFWGLLTELLGKLDTGKNRSGAFHPMSRTTTAHLRPPAFIVV